MERYCKVHGTYEVGFFSDACPGCREVADEERKAREHEKDIAREAIETAKTRAREDQLQAFEDGNRAYENRQREAERAEEAEWRKDEQIRQDREREDQREEEAEGRAEERADMANHLRANPGDYKCPSCFYITLKKNCLVCPICREKVPVGHWNVVKREEEAAATALRVQEAEYARLEAIRRAMLAEAWKLGEPERIAARAAEEHKRIASEAKANRLMHVNAFLIYLNFLWAAPLWGAICGVIFGIAGAVIGQFSAGSTASYGAGLGLSIGSIIGVIFVILRLVVNVRKHLSGSSNLLWIDILTICMIISIGVSLFVFVQKPEEMISQYFLDSPKKKDQSQTKKGIAVNSMKKSLQPTTGLATLSPGQVESPPVGVDPQTTPSTTYTMRMRDLTEKKYKGVLGGQDQDYKISGSFDATRPPTEALRFTAQREGGALPINFKSKSLTKETPYLQDYSGSWECDRYSGVCDIQIQNNGDYMLIYLYENEPTGNKSVATMIVNRTMK